MKDFKISLRELEMSTTRLLFKFGLYLLGLFGPRVTIRQNLVIIGAVHLSADEGLLVWGLRINGGCLFLVCKFHYLEREKEY